MATLFPGNIDIPQTNVDDSDYVLAADVNNVQDSANAAQVALGANPLTISDSVAGSPLAVPNVLGGYNGVVSNFPTQGASGTQIAYASIVATILKRIMGSGSATYRHSPVTDLTTLKARPYITNGTDTGNLPSSIPITSILAQGTLAARPAAAAGNSGWMYVVTSGGDASNPNYSVSQSNGSTWVKIGFYAQGGSAAQGDLIKYNAVSQQWERLPVGVAGQVLAVVGTDVQYTTPAGVMISEPSTLNLTTGIYTPYGTIQAAIDGIGPNQIVVIPPGTYDENIVIASNVKVFELISGTVTIAPSLGSPVDISGTAVLCVDKVVSLGTTGIYINDSPTVIVREISVSNIGVTGGARGIDYAAGSGARVYVDIINADASTSGGGTCYGILSAGDLYAEIGSIDASTSVISGTGNTKGIRVTAGTNIISVRDYITASDSTAGATRGVSVTGGTLTLLHTGPITATTTGGTEYDLEQTGGTLNVYSAQYDTGKTTGTITLLDGDRESTGNPDIAAGRLTPTSGTPLTSTGALNVTTIYFSPFKGNRISLYHGAGSWATHTFAELSIGVTSSQTGTTSNGSAVVTALTSTAQLTVGMEVTGTSVPGSTVISTIDSATQITLNNTVPASGARTLTFKIPASKLVDIFIYDVAGNGGPAITFGPLWTNTTTRATALAMNAGVRVLSGSRTVNGVAYAEGQLRYLGTIYTTTTAGETQDASSGRYIVNANNDVDTVAFLEETADISLSTTGYNAATATLSFLCLGGEHATFMGALPKGSNATQDHRWRFNMDSGTLLNAGATSAGGVREHFMLKPYGLLGAGIHTVLIEWTRIAASNTATNRPTTEPTDNWRRIGVMGIRR